MSTDLTPMTPAEIGALIRAARERRGLSVPALAALLYPGLAPDAPIATYERGWDGTPDAAVLHFRARELAAMTAALAEVEGGAALVRADHTVRAHVEDLAAALGLTEAERDALYAATPGRLPPELHALVRRPDLWWRVRAMLREAPVATPPAPEPSTRYEARRCECESGCDRYCVMDLETGLPVKEHDSLYDARDAEAIAANLNAGRPGG